ncbi:Na(+)/citrate cotransporter-like [Ornithodoros turicata]|uniref:Na(+)/citrate cotransporter-like n=1 Tax=Ornithodoros turicata TaxID=34597 RepID=UPI003139D528
MDVPQQTRFMATESSISGMRDILDPVARWRSQRLLLGCAAPFLLAPLLALGTQASKCLYAIMVVCSLWLSQLIPVQAAGLVPLLLISALGIAPTRDVARAYYDDNVLGVICCCVLACCFEESRLPKRIALLLLHLRLGYKALTLTLVFAFSTAATTIVARRTFSVTIYSLLVRALAREMRCTAKLRSTAAARSLQPTIPAVTTADDPKVLTEAIDEEPAEVKKELREYQQLQNALLIIVAFSSHLGSSFFFTGSQRHLHFMELCSKTMEPGTLTAGAWIAVNAPSAIILILLICVAMRTFYILKLDVYSRDSYDHRKEMNFIFSSQYSEMGQITAWEALMAFFLFFFVAVQFTRQPVLFHGWAEFLNAEGYVSDATSSALVLLVMGFVPIRLMELMSRHRVLNWRVVLPELPWGIALVLGAGNAFAYAANKTGLTDTTVSWLDRVTDKPILTQVGLSFSSAFSAQFTRKFLDAPRLHQIVDKSVQDRVHPMMYILPTASASSFSYVMPTASVANVMVYRYGDVAPVQMLISSMVLLACSCLLTVGSYHVLERSPLSHYLPHWGNSTRL